VIASNASSWCMRQPAAGLARWGHRGRRPSPRAPERLGEQPVELAETAERERAQKRSQPGIPGDDQGVTGHRRGREDGAHGSIRGRRPRARGSVRSRFPIPWTGPT
jgi:hypothetical protein